MRGALCSTTWRISSDPPAKGATGKHVHMTLQGLSPRARLGKAKRISDLSLSKALTPFRPCETRD